MRKGFPGAAGDESGQAFLDYIMTLLVVVTMISLIATGFRRSLFAVWETITQEVAAPCPGCATDENYRLR